MSCEARDGTIIPIPEPTKLIRDHNLNEEQILEAKSDMCSMLLTLYEARNPYKLSKEMSVPHGPLIELTFWLLISALVAVSGLWSWKKMRGAGRGSS
jgi:hypothetical protein